MVLSLEDTLYHLANVKLPHVSVRLCQSGISTLLSLPTAVLLCVSVQVLLAPWKTRPPLLTSEACSQGWTPFLKMMDISLNMVMVGEWYLQSLWPGFRDSFFSPEGVISFLVKKEGTTADTGELRGKCAFWTKATPGAVLG